MLVDLLWRSAAARPHHPALVFRDQSVSFAALAEDVRLVAKGLADRGVTAGDRVAVLLDKSFESVAALLGISAAGAVFVPVNPALRSAQIGHMLGDCGVKLLITTASRLNGLADILPTCRGLRAAVVIGQGVTASIQSILAVETWDALRERGRARGEMPAPVADTAMAGILYTSGSTGNAKGVIHSHGNFTQFAATVAEYLKYRDDDRILNLPPYSFGFGLSQLFTSLQAGVTAVLHNFLTAEELMTCLVEDRVTGVSAVPTVMMQLAAMTWPEQAKATLRYVSVAGGRMPEAGLRQLRRMLPQAEIYLMYGLTEGLRTTYLPPEEIDRHPDSMGRAIPGVEVFVVRPDGSLCEPGEPGELVHAGALVAQGYWNDPDRTAQKFRLAPGGGHGAVKVAVWSGDIVTRDAKGLLYFVGRQDDMIKTSGYRVSPTEVEDAALLSGVVGQAAALGVPDPERGQAIVLFVTPKSGTRLDTAIVADHCRVNIPAYMVPQRIVVLPQLPLNVNGKLDRLKLAGDYAASGAWQIERRQQDRRDADPARTGSFAQRWTAEIFALLGVKRRAFRTVGDIFAWHFPRRAIDRNTSFLSLEGDSLSYVGVSTGLQEIFETLPRNWEEMSIADLESLRRRSSAKVQLKPEIALRALAILAIGVVHSGADILTGGASLLMLLSGYSFARFQWSGDGVKTFKSILRFAAQVALPAWAMIFAVSAYRGSLDWSVVLFYSNLVSPWEVDWWPHAWFIAAIFQIWLMMAVLALIPGVARYASAHRFDFGLMLVVAGVLIDSAMVYSETAEHLAVKTWYTEYFVWIFGLGWLLAACKTNSEKIKFYFVMILSLEIVFSTHGFLSFAHAFGPSFVLWLLIGSALVLWVPSITVPRAIAQCVTLLARATLFIYIFHWPAAVFFGKALHTTFAPLQFSLGYGASFGLWVLWESAARVVNFDRVRLLFRRYLKARHAAAWPDGADNTGTPAGAADRSPASDLPAVQPQIVKGG